MLAQALPQLRALLAALDEANRERSRAEVEDGQRRARAIEAERPASMAKPGPTCSRGLPRGRGPLRLVWTAAG
jgi:hypothetical protein